MEAKIDDKCEYYPREAEECVCYCNSDISGRFICTEEYSKTCQWANERRKQEKGGDLKSEHY